MLAALKIQATPLSNAFRSIEPTWRNYIYYVDLSAKAGDEAMAKVIASYTALPAKERNSIMPEKLIDLAGVESADLISAVSRQVWLHKQSESTITASMNHPKVIEQTAAYAISRFDAFKDRELFMRLTGTLPDKKGASIVINNTPQTANFTTPSSAGMSGFRPMDQRVIEMSKLLDEPAEVIAVPMSVQDTEDVFEDDNEPED